MGSELAAESGQAGNLQGKTGSGGNIFEGERRRDYPMKPLRSSPFTTQMDTAARRLNWDPFQGPAAITTELFDGRPPCQYHGFCNKGGCHVQAKSSTAVTTIPKALDTGNLEVVTFARVTEIVVDDSGRVSGVRQHFLVAWQIIRVRSGVIISVTIKVLR